MLNKVTLMGRLTRDPERRETSNGTAVTSFTLACERDYTPKGEEKQADFFDIVCWRNTAEFTSKWFHKGQLVAVAGRLQTRKWTDKDGRNRVAVEIVADEAHFAEKRSDSGKAPAYSEPYAPAQSTFTEMDNDDSSDLPF